MFDAVSGPNDKHHLKTAIDRLFLQLWKIMLMKFVTGTISVEIKWNYLLLYMPSSVIASMQYNPESQTLRIIFVSGMVYDYVNVPPEIYAAMKRSGSKGTYLNQYIKGHFVFKKVS